MNNEVVGYMCSIAFDHEVGADVHGTKIYPSEEALLASHTMANDCGITKVWVTSDSKVANMQEVIDDRNDKLRTLDTEGVSELTGILYQKDFKIEELEAKVKTLKEFIEFMLKDNLEKTQIYKEKQEEAQILAADLGRASKSIDTLLGYKGMNEKRIEELEKQLEDKRDL